MQYLDLSKLKDDDIYLMNIEQEWRLIYKDTARLYSRKAGSSQDRMRILKDIVRFRATPRYLVRNSCFRSRLSYQSDRTSHSDHGGFYSSTPNDSHRYSGSNYGKSHGDYEKLRSSSLNELSRAMDNLTTGPNATILWTSSKWYWMWPGTTQNLALFLTQSLPRSAESLPL